MKRYKRGTFFRTPTVKKLKSLHSTNIFFHKPTVNEAFVPQMLSATASALCGTRAELTGEFIQKLFLEMYQFINVVNGVNHSHKTANIFFSFDSVA